jgi:hypothetical protein
MTKMFENVRTICVGRFLIDVPLDAQVIYGPVELPYPIRRIVGRGVQFDEVIKENLAEIENARQKCAWGSLAQKGSLLGTILSGRVPSQKIVFGLSRESGSNYVLESYQRVETTSMFRRPCRMGRDMPGSWKN